LRCHADEALVIASDARRRSPLGTIDHRSSGRSATERKAIIFQKTS
jgi:hypothetical protein